MAPVALTLKALYLGFVLLLLLAIIAEAAPAPAPKEGNERVRKMIREKMEKEKEKEIKGGKEVSEGKGGDTEDGNEKVRKMIKEKMEKEKEKEKVDSKGSPSSGSSSVPTPSPVSSGRKRVRCKNRNYDQCYGQEHVCPSSCASTCEVDCATCKPVCNCDYPGAVCQDPRFIGGDGITFYFHGKKNKDFCVVSDSNLHINAHFIGKTSLNMTRHFTWVQSLGILFNTHKLFIGALQTDTWDESVDRLALTLNGELVFLDETEGFTWLSDTTPVVSIIRISNTNSVVIDIKGILKISAKVVPITEEESMIHNYGITKDDCFAHLDLSFKFYSLGSKVDGVLGRTYRDDYVSKVKMGITMPVMGGDAEFETSSLFEPDCAVARFQVGETVNDEGFMRDLSSLSCASGMGGAGVICKR